MSINRCTKNPEKIRITIYPHLREHNRQRYFQVGVLVEEILGVVDDSYIYYANSIERLVGKLASLKSEWQRPNSYAIQIISKAPGFERIFWPIYSLIGDLIDMTDKEYKEFQRKFEKRICRRH